MLTSKQRAYLRSLGNAAEPVLTIGKGQVADSIIKQADEALEARELIKVNVLKTSTTDAKEVCGILCDALGCEPVQVIGSRFLIYRPSSEKPVIELPR